MSASAWILNTRYVRTWKRFGRRFNRHKTFSECWPGEHVGRYVKRRLAKARRRAAAEEIYSEVSGGRPHARGLSGIEGEANWKTW